jgi:RNA polymerase sigma-70 factor (ECF subfamily)
MSQSEQTRELAEAVLRRSYGKLLAILASRIRDVTSAEDALAEAFTIALEDWPVKGRPTNPEAWLLTVARRKMIDSLRRRSTAEAASMTLDLNSSSWDPLETDSEIPDRRLALMFACAHPAIDVGIRAPLMLQCVLGLDAKTIASSFLISPTTMAKRLVRAKDKIRQARIPFLVPEVDELSPRLNGVLDAIYACFTEGWSDPTGTDLVRRDLTEEALFLARLVVDLVPDEPEATGLLSLLLHAQARRRARRNERGEYVPFSEQEIALWDRSMILEAETLLRKASHSRVLGRYQLEAALQSAHVYRRETGNQNWKDVLSIYDALLAFADSPVIAVNRSLALAEVEGASKALASLTEVAEDRRVAEYQPYWAARAELLVRTGEILEASHAYDMAIGLERDPAARRFLQRRRMALLDL